jgi:hypothetical protein
MKRKQNFECKTWGFHSGDYEEWGLPWWYAFLLFYEQKFLRNVGSYKSHTA